MKKEDTELTELEQKLKDLEAAERKKELLKKIEDIELKNKYTLSNGKEVKMRKPKARDMKKAEKEATGEIEKELMLIGDLAELTPTEVDDLDMDDYAVYQRKLKDFFS